MEQLLGGHTQGVASVGHINHDQDQLIAHVTLPYHSYVLRLCNLIWQPVQHAQLYAQLAAVGSHNECRPPVVGSFRCIHGHLGL